MLTRSAAGVARHYNLRLPTEGFRQGHIRSARWLAPGCKGLRQSARRRPKGPMFASLGPISALCCPRLALCWPQVSLPGPWPYLGLMLAFVGPIFAPCWPRSTLCWPMLRHRDDEFCPPVLKHVQHVVFSVRGLPCTPKPCKTRGFLTVPR